MLLISTVFGAERVLITFYYYCTCNWQIGKQELGLQTYSWWINKSYDLAAGTEFMSCACVRLYRPQKMHCLKGEPEAARWEVRDGRSAVSSLPYCLIHARCPLSNIQQQNYEDCFHGQWLCLNWPAQTPIRFIAKEYEITSLQCMQCYRLRSLSHETARRGTARQGTAVV